MENLETLKQEIVKFCADRDWLQFHSPKNLSMGLACESAELLEIFQWMTEEESCSILEDRKKAEAVRHELADILYFLLLIAHKLNIDLVAAAKEKLIHNALKYPIALSKGSRRKYTDRD